MSDARPPGMYPKFDAVTVTQFHKRQRSNKTGFLGVSWHAKVQVFLAYICVHGRFRHLGYFDDITDAAEAIRVGALKYHGSFAYVARPKQ